VTPRGAAIDVFFNLDVLQEVVVVASIYCQHLPGATVVNYHYCRATSKAFHENFFYPCDAKDSKKPTMKKISSNITKIEFIYKTKVSAS
jgi:hypothetical protein